jgi:hypothetical protein
MERAEAYHMMVAKGLFLCKRAQPDIQPAIGVLCTRVKEPIEADWVKLTRMMKYLNGTVKLRLMLSAGNLHCIKWYVDASVAVHPITKVKQALPCHSTMVKAQYYQFPESRN